MTPVEQARADVEAWRDKVHYLYKWDCVIPNDEIADLITRLTPVYERAQKADEGWERARILADATFREAALLERAERAETERDAAHKHNQQLAVENDRQVARWKTAEAECERLRAQVERL